MQYQLTPNTISTLPGFDVVLLLTVYHHWVNAFGREAAESMLQEVAGNTNKIIFEPPGEAYQKFSNIGHRPIGDDETTVEYYTDLLESILDEQVDITHLGNAEYPSHDERTDPIFLLECKDYNG